jgi:hypothetical protein
MRGALCPLAGLAWTPVMLRSANLTRERSGQKHHYGVPAVGTSAAPYRWKHRLPHPPGPTGRTDGEHGLFVTVQVLGGGTF